MKIRDERDKCMVKSGLIICGKHESLMIMQQVQCVYLSSCTFSTFMSAKEMQHSHLHLCQVHCCILHCEKIL